MTRIDWVVIVDISHLPWDRIHRERNYFRIGGGIVADGNNQPQWTYKQAGLKLSTGLTDPYPVSYPVHVHISLWRFMEYRALYTPVIRYTIYAAREDTLSDIFRKRRVEDSRGCSIGSTPSPVEAKVRTVRAVKPTSADPLIIVLFVFGNVLARSHERELTLSTS